MKILLAKTAGFCFGVKRAVNIVENLLAQGMKVCTLGPLIHNMQVVNKFKELGVIVVEDVRNIPKGYILVIRSHGVSEKIINYLKENGIEYVDGTCPFVKKIHKIVKNESNSDKIVLIAGDKNHPEVEAILGYCRGKSVVFKNSDELKKMYKSHIISRFDRTIIVAQTTFDIKEWAKCVNLTKNLFTKPIIYDTICNTTQLRQKEAEKLSKKSNCMFVIGDKNSSNTNKLYNICQKNCPTVLIESIKDFDCKNLKDCECVGITAGASTPEKIIEEVKGAMVKDGENNESFEELLEASLKESPTGRRVKGTVVSVSPNEVCVDVGMKQAGIIPKSEMTNVPNEKLEDIVKVGDELNLLIIHVNDQEGTVTLSKLKADYDNNWDEIFSKYESKETLTGIVSQVVKSGILVRYKCFNVFIPSSHIGGNKGIPFESYVGKEVKFKIIEVNKFKKRIVGSIKEVKNAEKEKCLKEFWDSVEIGKTYKGVVKSMTSYAVFVDLGCVDGIVHISELTWDRKKKPADVVSLGQEIEVKVKSFNKENGKLSLSYKKQEDSPWEIIKRDYKEDTVFETEIVSLVPFGAFARVIPGIDGLIHISQISDHRIESPGEVLSVGQKVLVKVREVNEDTRRLSLTMKGIELNESSAQEKSSTK